MSKLIFAEDAWEEYLYWQMEDRRILKRINALLKEIQRSPFEGTGKPEPLKEPGAEGLMKKTGWFTR